jgi:hypothetical protein
MADSINLHKVKQQALNEARENIRSEIARARKTRLEAEQRALDAEKIAVSIAKRSRLETEKALGESKGRAERDLRRKDFKKTRQEHEEAVLVAAKQRKQAILLADQVEKQAILAAERAAEAYVNKATAEAREVQQYVKDAESNRIAEEKEEKGRTARVLKQKSAAEVEAKGKRPGKESKLSQTVKGTLAEHPEAPRASTVQPEPSVLGASHASPAKPEMHTTPIGVPAAAPNTAFSVLSPVQINILINRGTRGKIREFETSLRQRPGVRIIMFGGEGDTTIIVVMATSVESLAQWLQELPIIDKAMLKGKEITLTLKSE